MIMKTRFIPDGKDKLKTLPIHHHQEAEYLYYPITNARCPEGETCVIDGQDVKVGELIGTRRASFFEQPIHATVSGRIVAHEKKYNEYGKLVNFVIVKMISNMKCYESVYERSDEEIEKLTKEEFVDIVKEMGLVVRGSAFPNIH